MSTQEVLDQIDAAVHDWEVGPDAMRSGGPKAPPAIRVTAPMPWSAAWVASMRIATSQPRVEDAT